MNHLHVYVKYASRIRKTGPDFDSLMNFHGNYAVARSAKDVIRYITKDNDYVTYNFPDDLIARYQEYAIFYQNEERAMFGFGPIDHFM